MLVVVSILIFLATQGLPSDIAKIILGRQATPMQVLQLRHQLHLDEPLVRQYVHWLFGILSGQLGDSLAARRPIWELLAPRVLNSFFIVVVSMTAALPASVLGGAMSAFRKDGIIDRSLLGCSLAINAMPEFVLGMLLVVLFSTNVSHVLPAVSMIAPGDPPWAAIGTLILPSATLALLQATYLYRLVRASVIDVLATDYIQLAVLKGLPNSRILFRHALPNAILPTVQAAANVFAYSVGGVVAVEYVFNFPGIGSALADAVGDRDIPVVQFIVLLIAFTFFVSNLLADLVAAYLSPPSRHGLK